MSSFYNIVNMLLYYVCPPIKGTAKGFTIYFRVVRESAHCRKADAVWFLLLLLCVCLFLCLVSFVFVVFVVVLYFCGSKFEPQYLKRISLIEKSLTAKLWSPCLLTAPSCGLLVC